MRKIYFALIIVCLHFSGLATTWYSQGTGAPNTLSNWNSVPTGGGSSPANFTTSGDLFYMQTNMSGGSGTWTLGTGTTLQIDNVSFSNSIGTINCYNLQITGTSYVPGTTANNFYITGDLTISGSAYLDNPPSFNYLHFSNTSSSLSNPQHCTITTSGYSLWTYMYIDAGVTVALTSNATWNQNVVDPFTISGTLDCGPYTWGGNVTFTLNSGAALYTQHTGGIAGAITTTGTKTFSTGATYAFTGTAAQVTSTSLPAALVSPAQLIINNAAGVTLSQSTSNTTTTGALVFGTSGGVLSTGANTLTVPGSSTAVTNASTSNYVNGTLIKTISGVSTLNYEIGTSTAYKPVTLTLSSAGTGGSLGAKITVGLHPSASTSGITTSQMVNEYWTISNTGATGPATAILLTNYASGDVLGGSNANFIAREYSGGSWSGTYSSTNTSSPYTSTTTSIALGSLAGDYIFGNVRPITGTLSVCPFSTTTLTDSFLTGGTWSSANTTIGTIDPVTGVFTGLSQGLTAITYSLSGGISTAVATVNALPPAIVGSSNFCIGSTTTLTDPTTGGLWVSSNPGIATIGSGTGIVTGVTAGVVTISYTPGGAVHNNDDGYCKRSSRWNNRPDRCLPRFQYRAERCYQRRDMEQQQYFISDSWLNLWCGNWCFRRQPHDLLYRDRYGLLCDKSNHCKYYCSHWRRFRCLHCGIHYVPH